MQGGGGAGPPVAGRGAGQGRKGGLHVIQAQLTQNDPTEVRNEVLVTVTRWPRLAASATMREPMRPPAPKITLTDMPRTSLHHTSAVGEQGAGHLPDVFQAVWNEGP